MGSMMLLMVGMSGMFDLSIKTGCAETLFSSWGSGIFKAGSTGFGLTVVIVDALISCRILWQDARVRLNIRGPNLLHWLVQAMNMEYDGTKPTVLVEILRCQP